MSTLNRHLSTAEIRNLENIKIDSYKFECATKLPNKPNVNWFNINIHDAPYEIALDISIGIVAYWYKNNVVPRFIEEQTADKYPDCHTQRDAIVKMVACLLQGKQGLQLLAGTGTGKTYMTLAVFDILLYYNFIEQIQAKENRIYPFAFVIFCPKNVVDQSQEVKSLYPNCKSKCIVINYETLRTNIGLGSIFIEWTTQSINGELEEIPSWRVETSPIGVLWDENQKLKNDSTLQTKLARAYRNLRHARYCIEIFCSATPFTRPSESKTVVLSLSPILELTDEYLLKVRKVWKQSQTVLKNEDKLQEFNIRREFVTKKIDHIPRVNSTNFNTWLIDHILPHKIKPTEYSAAAMERITDYLSAEHQLISVTDVRFKHKSINKHVLIEFFNKDEEKEQKSAYEKYVNDLLKINKDIPGGMAALFTAMLKFRMSSELTRREHIAKFTDLRIKEGKNVIVATCFKDTQEAVLNILRNKYGYKDNNISRIYGKQNRKQRWQNINNFQDEKSYIMLAMMQAGGVGLSLHQYNARNKRPRHIIMPPVWSIIDMLQMLGRGHRINSDSTTKQEILWYKGTIEEKIYIRLQDKAISTRELMRRKENWSDLFIEESEREHVDLKKVYNDNEHSNNDNDAIDSDNEDEESFFNVDEQIMAENVVIE